MKPETRFVVFPMIFLIINRNAEGIMKKIYMKARNRSFYKKNVCPYVTSVSKIVILSPASH